MRRWRLPLARFDGKVQIVQVRIWNAATASRTSGRRLFVEPLKDLTAFVRTRNPGAAGLRQRSARAITSRRSPCQWTAAGRSAYWLPE